MSGNRVEELEAKVRELEATIEGLTDELVETKERLGAIEDETDIQPDILEGRGTGFERQEETESSADAETTTEGGAEDESESDDTTDSESSDDIIVA